VVTYLKAAKYATVFSNAKSALAKFIR